MTIDTTKLRELAQEATPGTWYISAPGEQAVWHDIKDRRYLIADTSNGFTDDGNAEFIAAANPATVLALQDEIDSSRKALNAAKNIIKSQEWTISHMRSKTDQTKEALTTLDSEREANAALTAETDRLRTIEAAARNLVKVKGRDHSELAYQKLVEVLG